MKKTKEVRTRGAKPHDPSERAARVTAAVRALEKIGASFSVADIAERADVSRATIYRCADLRTIIGAKGDGPRLVDAAVYEKLAAKHDVLKVKHRELKRQFTETEASWGEMRDRAKLAEQKLVVSERRAEALAAQARGGSGGSLGAVAAHLGTEEMRRARRLLARALHPDLFAQDAATAALATELLKTLNALAE